MPEEREGPHPYQVVSDIRGVFARRYVNLSALHVHCMAGIVYVAGTADRVPGAPTPLTAADLGAIEHEVHQIRGVKRMEWRLDNWMSLGGQQFAPVVVKGQNAPKPVVVPARR